MLENQTNRSIEKEWREFRELHAPERNLRGHVRVLNSLYRVVEHIPTEEIALLPVDLEIYQMNPQDNLDLLHCAGGRILILSANLNEAEPDVADITIANEFAALILHIEPGLDHPRFSAEDQKRIDMKLREWNLLKEHTQTKTT